jgi:chemotaxis protein methyltransferase CheR
MKDEQCVSFLQWALPQLKLRWPGYRKVRRQVCKRVGRRLEELGLGDLDQYRVFLQCHAEEWGRLDDCCRITISRFYRDRRVFDRLGREVLPTLAGRALDRGDEAIRVWSVGCGSGEEPYTLAILWALELQSRFPALAIEITATDADYGLIQRAGCARYSFGSLKELPAHWRERAFSHGNDSYRLEPGYRRPVEFRLQDIRRVRPQGAFDLVLCRNLVFTYFDNALQVDVLKRITGAMRAGAALVIGIHEHLPADGQGLLTWFEKERICQKAG